MTVLLSIITVTWNNGEGLGRTVHSCERWLTDPRVELVVVDGASSKDDTPERLAQLRARGNDNIVTLSEPDKGIYDAMNKGLTLARGRHVVFMNAGDTFAEAFQLDLSTIEPNVTYYGDALFHAPDGSRFHKHYVIDDVRAFLSHNTFSHQALFYPRELLLQLGGYDRSYKVSADFDLTLQTFLRSPFRALNQTVCECELGGFSHVHGWRSYRDRMRSVRSHCHTGLWLILVTYAPVFWLKHRVVKALDGSRLLNWYRAVRYGLT